MNHIINLEDPLGSDFDISFLELFCSTPTTNQIVNDTPSLFLNQNQDFNLNLDNWSTESLQTSSTSSTSTSQFNSPTLNNTHTAADKKKKTLLCSPLQDYHDLYLTTTSNNINSQQQQQQQNPESSMMNNDSNKIHDILSPDYTTQRPNNNNNNKYRIGKSSSPLMRPPMKPSVTIANIDTYSRLDAKVSTKSTIPKTKVGNPFYKSPIHHKKKHLPVRKTPKVIEDDDKIIYDLLTDNNNDTNAGSSVYQYPILETKFKILDDHLIFDGLFDPPPEDKVWNI
ncbi:hypothetical protein G210_3060 [Candida maltosa Xu316]|uniref:Uncharacterized protein n=1 Tax=Candida maltosa (strain Xu316) TaxID=1245528 RepID=M3IJX5_CANMX|nr:hypothetical protein G210_3060 [Candida maltosa Xu316]